MSEPDLAVVAVDLDDPSHQRSLVDLLDEYARGSTGGGEPLSEFARSRLVPALRGQSTYAGFLALRGARAVGLVNAFFGFSTFAARPLLNIHDLFVHREARRRGVARRLLESVEELARDRGCCKLTLEVLSGNGPARAAYDAAGFRSSTLDPAMGEALFLEKKLPQH